MVWPILISLSVTPGAFWAVAGIAIAPLRSKQPDKIRNTPLRASGDPGSGYPVTGLGGFSSSAGFVGPRGRVYRYVGRACISVP